MNLEKEIRLTVKELLVICLACVLTSGVIVFLLDSWVEEIKDQEEGRNILAPIILMALVPSLL